MKRVLWMPLLVVVSAGLSGCCCGRASLYGTCEDSPENCASCSSIEGECDCQTCSAACDGPHRQGCGCLACCRRAGYGPENVFTPGPASAAITYPYYTVRGPRDFLAASPRPLGP